MDLLPIANAEVVAILKAMPLVLHLCSSLHPTLIDESRPEYPSMIPRAQIGWPSIGGRGRQTRRQVPKRCAS
jgi:hypothetical protein